MLARLNELLYEDLDRANHFITACCATVDAASGELRYASAGHPPAMLLRSGETRWSMLNPDGMPLGTRRAIDFDEVKVAVQTGDILVLYTDGITEARNAAGSMFGTQRLGETVAANRHDEPEKLLTAILAALDGFRGSMQLDDDVTLVVMKIVA